MKKIIISFALIYILAIQPSYQIDFKTAQLTTGPYGGSSGKCFNSFNMDETGFNKLPNEVTVNLESGGIKAISFAYYTQGDPIIKTAGTISGGATDTKTIFNIVKAEVCTGKRSGSTVIIGVKFTDANGAIRDFHGDTSSVSDLSCTDATPATPGYYLQYLSAKSGTYINQLKLHWISNFAQEKDCVDDLECKQDVEFCLVDCCWSKFESQAGEWETSVFCA